MILLVIGGSGFFGKSIVDSFQNGFLAKWKISKLILIARHDSSSLRLLLKKSENIEFIYGDICTLKTIPKCDYVIHAASNTDVRKYKDNPAFEKMNIELGVSNFVEIIKNINFQPKIMYISSGAVYGDLFLNKKPVSESSEISNSFTHFSKEKKIYALAKINSEQLLRSIAKEFKIIIVRAFAFIGPHTPLDQHFFVGNLIDSIINNKIPKLINGNSVYRSFLSSFDLVENLLLILNEDIQSGEIYNVGSDEIVEIHEFTKFIVKFYLNKSVEYNVSNSNYDWYVPNISKISSLKGYQKRYNLKQSFHNVIKFHEKK